MHRHGGSGRDKALLGRNGQGHPDGVTTSQHQGNGGLFHAGDQLGNGQPGLHIPSHCVEQDQQPVDLIAFFDGRQLRHHMLIFGGLILGRQDHMPLHLPHNGKTVDRRLLFVAFQSERADLTDGVHLFFRHLSLLLFPLLMVFDAILFFVQKNKDF